MDTQMRKHLLVLILMLYFFFRFLFQGDVCSLVIEVPGVIWIWLDFFVRLRQPLSTFLKFHWSPRDARNAVHHPWIGCKLCQSANITIRTYDENLALPSFHSLSPKSFRINFDDSYFLIFCSVGYVFVLFTFHNSVRYKLLQNLINYILW